MNTLIFECFGGFEGLPNKVTTSEKSNIRTFAEYLGLTNLEGSSFGGEVGHFGASQSEIHRTFVLGSGDGGHFGLVEVAGHEYRHVRQGFHQSNVFHCLMGSTVFTKRNACVAAADFYILIGIGHYLAYLV